MSTSCWLYLMSPRTYCCNLYLVNLSSEIRLYSNMLVTMVLASFHAMYIYLLESILFGNFAVWFFIIWINIYLELWHLSHNCLGFISFNNNVFCLSSSIKKPSTKGYVQNNIYISILTYTTLWHNFFRPVLNSASKLLHRKDTIPGILTFKS